MRAQGDTAGAIAAYRAAIRSNLLYAPSYVYLGDLLRATGQLDEARRVYRPQYASEQTLLDLAWRDTVPVAQPVIEVGDGLDFGYLNGFYPAEELAGARVRWTGPVARIRVPATARVARLRVAALRPDAPVAGHICSESQCHSFTIGVAWRWLIVQLPPASTTAPLRDIELRVTPWPAPDGRELGVVVDTVEVR